MGTTKLVWEPLDRKLSSTESMPRIQSSGPHQLNKKRRRETNVIPDPPRPYLGFFVWKLEKKPPHQRKPKPSPPLTTILLSEVYELTDLSVAIREEVAFGPYKYQIERTRPTLIAKKRPSSPMATSKI